MTTTNMSSLQNLVLTNAVTPPKRPAGNFFEALATAWGAALDKQAQIIQEKSNTLNQDGGDTPSAITELSAESARISFMANSSHTSLSEAAEALKAVAQK